MESFDSVNRKPLWLLQRPHKNVLYHDVQIIIKWLPSNYKKATFDLHFYHDFDKKNADPNQKDYTIIKIF